ncbi:hypothetical protein BUALT_Bualt18G0055100 [Buddleja alternifolia]|uniref:Bet v I/Major latex protein domain-containing protein n=1 Tax=Buddleja alternifolia TaxID=168488 RepID=A0AAV6WAQ3_9LAMI|nr:hypothetical protein BUALT_Bualt18G0055100 [Buddleja alternifolia]
MRRQEKGQVKVKIGVEVIWRALAKDFKSVVPSSIPNLVKDVEMLEGDGGFGTVYLFNFGPGVPNMSYQKEKIVEFDESQHRIALQVIEGGRLDVGFTFHKATFQLTATGDSETMVDLKVDFETESQETNATGGMIKSVVAFTQALETFLLK